MAEVLAWVIVPGYQLDHGAAAFDGFDATRACCWDGPNTCQDRAAALRRGEIGVPEHV